MTATYTGDVASWYADVWGPACGRPLDATDLAVNPAGDRVAFTASILDSLESRPGSAVVVVDLTGGEGAETARVGADDAAPAWSADGSLWWLSSGPDGGGAQVWTRTAGAEARQVTSVEGAVEEFRLSPDGVRLALLVATAGTDRPSVRNSGVVDGVAASSDASWRPRVDEGRPPGRRLRFVDLADGQVAAPADEPGDVWQVRWAGPATLLVLASDVAGESGWYDADVRRYDVVTDEWRPVFRPQRQIELHDVDVDGERLLAVAGLASDRAVVAGRLVVIDAATGACVEVPTEGVDVSSARWRRTSDAVCWAGLRGERTVVGETDVRSGRVRELWSGDDTCGGPIYPSAEPVAEADALLVREGTCLPPRLVRSSAPDDALWDGSHPGVPLMQAAIGAEHEIAWTSPDGLRLGGLLTLPPGDGPFPLLTEIHGGPVGAARRTWVLRNRLQALGLARGFAVFRPNPRGSSGRGDAHREAILGAMGGADLDDVHAGVDRVVADFPVDAERMVVAGASYGGYLTYVAVTRDQRFAAAVAVAPIADYLTAAYTCNIPRFVEMFLGAAPSDRTGGYAASSPLLVAGKVQTPTMTIVGGADRCSPPSQGEMFHGALVEAGRVLSVLLSYPAEGHGLRDMRAVVDAHTRLFAFLDEHLDAAATAAQGEQRD